MPALKSSILIINHPYPERITFGADFAKDWEEASARLEKQAYDVIVLPLALAPFKDLLNFLQLSKNKKAERQLIVTSELATPDQLLNVTSNYSIYHILEDFSDSQLENIIQSALAEVAHIKQNEQLKLLTQEQNDRLKNLSSDLEDRVEKRQKYLQESKRKLLLTNRKLSALREALVSIHQSTSVGELENRLIQVLGGLFDLKWVRIFFQPQDQNFAQNEILKQSFALLQVSLFRAQENIGSIYFLRESNHVFNKSDSDFLHRVAEAVSLALDRLMKLEQTEGLKQQWEATFNSISEPLSLVNQSYEVMQVNQSFLDKMGTSTDTLARGQKCYKVLFNRSSPCTGCKLGERFRLEQQYGHEDKMKHLEVSSQPIQFGTKESPVFVNLYRDITRQLQMEEHLIESARMAELGVIGSSIAHELNNPLGGLLSFVQLIKADLPKDSPFLEDIELMEEGAGRCRDIVQNLLGFTRTPEADPRGPISLKEVIERAIKIMDLQTRSKGIQIKLNSINSDCTINGHRNLLSQAIKNILQVFIDNLSVQMRQQKGFLGLVEINISEVDSKYVVLITDNSLGTLATPGPGISLAQQIMHEHLGELEFFARLGEKMSARISFPSPDFKA